MLRNDHIASSKGPTDSADIISGTQQPESTGRPALCRNPYRTGGCYLHQQAIIHSCLAAPARAEHEAARGFVSDSVALIIV
eukprot:246572-Pelagomonas_calceolata.AAC.1